MGTVLYLGYDMMAVRTLALIRDFAADYWHAVVSPVAAASETPGVPVIN